MKNYLVLLVFFILNIGICSAQTLERFVVSTGGDFQNSANGSLSFTVGEISVKTLSGSNSILTQGFQQSDTSTINIVEENNSSFNIDIFPNPVSEFLTFQNKINHRFLFSFYDESGRSIAVPELKSDSQIIFDVSELAGGLYLLVAADSENRTFATKKFVKQ